VVEVEALHRAAERIWDEAGTREMDGLAEAIGEFIRSSDITAMYRDGTGATPLFIDPKSFGYGAMIGFLAARDEG
jgi:hypothetical protein